MSTSFFQQVKQISKSLATLVSWTLFALLTLIIGFLVYYLVCTNIYAKRGEKFEPPFSLYTIVSPSMEPNINVYDVILNKKVKDAKDIKVGDVITFISTSNISNGMTVTHRVVSIVEGQNGLEFKTKGDNNLSEDTDTAKEQNVLGKVVLKIPQLGRLQFFLSSKGGWLIIIIIPALFIIVNDILKIWKLNKAKKAISTAESDDNNEEKLKLEAFRKEEIKAKLDRKSLEKIKKLEAELKNKNEQKSKKKQLKKIFQNIIQKIEKKGNKKAEKQNEPKNVVDKIIEYAIDNYELPSYKETLKKENIEKVIQEKKIKETKEKIIPSKEKNFAADLPKLKNRK